MKAQAAVRRLNADIKAMHVAQATEKKQLASIQKQEQAVVDSFSSNPNPTPADELAALKKMFALGQSQVQTKDKFDAQISHDRADGRSMLKPAEPKLSFKQLNADRKALGLKALAKPPPSMTGGKGAAAVKIADAHLGKNISYLKTHGDLAKYLDKWPGNNVCCANFVSACLQEAGLIKHSEHNDSVKGLAHNLANDKNWSHVSSHNMKPGDVVCFNVPGEGPMSHVEIFKGYVHGRATFVGSNNVNADGSQRISLSQNTYPIGAVYRHH
jgi:hypothetical protein